MSVWPDRARTEGSIWASSLPVILALVSDIVLAAAAMLLAAAGRTRLPYFTETGDVDNLVETLGIPILVGWIAILALSGAYAVNVTGAGAGEFKILIRASLLTAGMIGVACYLAKFQFSRGFYILLFGIGIPLMFFGRYLLRLLVHRLRREGYLRHRVLLVGSPAQVDEVAHVLNRERWLGFEPVGCAVPNGDPTTVTQRGIAVVGTTEQTAHLIDELDADIVLFAGGAVSSSTEMRRTAWELEDSSVQIMVVPRLTDVASDRIRVRPAAGLPLIQVEGPRAHRASHVAKRAFDLVGSVLLLLLLSPLIVATALWIKIHDRGPVLFAQERVGRGGETFRCFKFRSMVVDAEALLEKIREQNKHDNDEHVLFKMENDPRVTRPGRLIRRLSIDEIPQLFNVVLGDMSLVGPRPPLQAEVDRYTSDVRRRLAVRPGMTGLWQVSGRSDLSWEDSVRLDLYYVDNWSMLQDLVILARTLRAVLASRGAY